ncbi:hypothetical protein PR202_ga19323 [Eleusine coracana subsp. coracana]|uniref:RING-type domain-containing protein n=1 Tax=Eleusine coracana subsp. coracana TaxID=191504 RepID=A0AAV5CU81_ELECO|nr:hypothetical protein PR202_ga19323 [Eleusine coracana subsp. coracana]
MDMLRGRTGKREVVISYMNAPLPYAIEDSFGGCFFEDDDDDLAQVLQDQEILYQLIQGNDGSGSSRARSAPSSSYGHDRISNERKPVGVANYELQLAVDEALARELQAMEGQLASTSLNNDNGRRNPTPSPASNSGSSYASTLPQVVVDDGIDPDNMTYENRDKLTKLPCEHQYHQACVAKWLQINKGAAGAKRKTVLLTDLKFDRFTDISSAKRNMIVAPELNHWPLGHGFLDLVLDDVYY